MRKGLGQVEALAELNGHEGMERFFEGPTRQQVRARFPQFTRAGSRQDKLMAFFLFDQVMNHTEEFRHLLNFIDDDSFWLRERQDLFFQAFGMGAFGTK